MAPSQPAMNAPRTAPAATPTRLPELMSLGNARVVRGVCRQTGTYLAQACANTLEPTLGVWNDEPLRSLKVISSPRNSGTVCAERRAWLQPHDNSLPPTVSTTRFHASKEAGRRVP